LDFAKSDFPSTLAKRTHKGIKPEKTQVARPKGRATGLSDVANPRKFDCKRLVSRIQGNHALPTSRIATQSATLDRCESTYLLYSR
jgi:hypothetical protein